MASVMIEIRSNHGDGEPLVIELPVPDRPEHKLDKPWPKMAPLSACKLILYHGCGTDMLHQFDNSLCQLRYETLEEACFDAIEDAVYDGLDDHQNFRSVRRKHRKEDFIALTAANQLIWLQTRTNQMREVPRIMEKWTIPEGAKYVYIGSVKHPTPEYIEAVSNYV